MSSAPGESGERRRVTDRDVAVEAGVSRATVYYVLNEDANHRIPDPTRQRVLDAVDKLRYVPFGPARMLRRGQSSVVLLLTHGLEHATDRVATDLVTALGAALESRGLHLVWQIDGEVGRDPSIDLAPVVVLSSAAPGEPDFARATADYPVPVLPAFPDLDRFTAAAAAAQAELAVGAGRTRLAYAALDEPALERSVALRREKVSGVAAAGRLPAVQTLLLGSTRDEARASLGAFLDQHPDVDVICAFNDEVAFRILAAARDLGIEVPSRVGVIGVDDLPFGAFTTPALTTVEPDLSSFVDAFADHIRRVCDGEEGEGPQLPTSFRAVRRGSL